MAPFGHPWGPLWALWALLGDGVEFGPVSGEKSRPFGTLLDPKIQKNQTRTKTKQGPENSVEKKCSQSSPETAQCVIRTVTTICFEGSRNVHSGGFWFHFGSLSGSLLDTFSEKTVIEELKKTDKNKHRNFMKKGHAESPSEECRAPKRGEASGTQELMNRRSQASVTPKCLKARWRIEREREIYA